MRVKLLMAVMPGQKYLKSEDTNFVHFYLVHMHTAQHPRYVVSIFSHFSLGVSGLLGEEICGVLKNNVGDKGGQGWK